MIVRLSAILVCLVPVFGVAQSVDAVVTGLIADATGAGVAGVTTTLSSSSREGSLNGTLWIRGTAFTRYAPLTSCKSDAHRFVLSR